MNAEAAPVFVGLVGPGVTGVVRVGTHVLNTPPKAITPPTAASSRSYRRVNLLAVVMSVPVPVRIILVRGADVLT